MRSSHCTATQAGKTAECADGLTPVAGLTDLNGGFRLDVLSTPNMILPSRKVHLPGQIPDGKNYTHPEQTPIAGEDKDYVLVLEKPRYTDCVYIDFSPQTFGWSVWQPRSP